MRHYECVALCKDISLQRGRFCARSLASCIPRSSEDSRGRFKHVQPNRGPHKRTSISIGLFIPRSSKEGHHECSSSRLCAAAPVVASSSLEDVQRWLGYTGRHNADMTASAKQSSDERLTLANHVLYILSQMFRTCFSICSLLASSPLSMPRS